MARRLTDPQRELLQDKFVVWERASREGVPDLRDYKARAAAALKAALALAAEAPWPAPWPDLAHPTTQRLMGNLSWLEGAQGALDGGSAASIQNTQDILSMALLATRSALRMIALAPGRADLPEPNPVYEAKAKAYHQEQLAREGAEPEQTALMLRMWSADAAPANEHGQVPFARAMLESAESALAAVIGERNRFRDALIALHFDARPENWNDDEDAEQVAAWQGLDAALTQARVAGWQETAPAAADAPL